MFYRCSIDCTACQAQVASLMVNAYTIPRAKLKREARRAGAVQDRAGRWYCGVGCRTAFRMTHNTSHRETPNVETD